MTWLHRRYLGAVVASCCVSLAACAAYRPSPLGAGDTLLSRPVAAILTAESSHIQRPYLEPVAIDLAKPLDLNAVSLVTVLRNPDLRSQRVRANIANAQLLDARLLPDPSVSFGIDKIVSGTDPFSNIIGSIAQEIMALRTRHARVQGAAAAARQVRLDLAWAEWQTAGQARIQATRIVQLQRAMAIAQVSRASAQDLLDRLLRASARGDISGDRVQAARIAEMQAADQLRSAAKHLAAARSELNKLMGLPPDMPLALADIPVPAPPPDPDRLLQLAEQQRLDLQALREGYLSQEAAVHVAVLNRFPNLNLSLAANRDTSGNKLLGSSVDLTLPVWNGNRGSIAIQESTRAALKAEFEARIFQTRAEIAAAVTALRLTWANRAVIQAQLPAIRHFVERSAQAAKRGDIPIANAAAAADTLREKELLLVQAEQDIIEQTIALELLTGVPQADWPA